MGGHTDSELVGLARGGDGSAIAQLFSRYWRAARAAAFGVTGELASAEDAAAEAFRQALVGLDSLRDPDRFGSWLRTIVVRQARLELHRHRHEVEPLVDDQSDSSQRPDAELERLELGVLIQRAVRELPDRLREAMALVYFEGYDSEATARFLDIPPGTLRRRLHDGREQLRSAIGRILQGSTRMNEKRERQILRVKSLIDNGEKYQGMREFLALRPPPNELIGLFIRHQMSSAHQSEAVAGGKAPAAFVREMAQRFTGPSPRASDPNHPVGAIAAAIRKVLPDFQDWPLNVGEAAERFFTFTGEHRDRLRTLLPPGFAEGRGGAFVRATRALLHLSENRPMQSIYELVQDSPDEETFRATKNDMRISDVLDLTWMVTGPLELRSVQEMLAGLSAALLPGEQVRFSPYDEPRYRSALQLHVGGLAERFAQGGVLAEWPGHPQGVDAAHLRIFLEPWATVQSGQVVDLDRLPQMPSPSEAMD